MVDASRAFCICILCIPFFVTFSFCFSFWLRMGHDTKCGGVKHVWFSHKRCLFSMEPYFSLSKHTRNCRKNQQKETCARSAPLSNALEWVQPLHDVTNAEE